MKQNFTELVFILDKSGSMSGLESDTIGGFNSLIEKQKKLEGEVVVTTVLFNDKCEVIHDRVNLNDVKKLTDDDYYVNGCTALLDAVGTTIKNINKIHKDLPEDEVPSKTLFVITTDGMENSSREYSYKLIAKMVSEQMEKGWDFIYLGANIDSVCEAGKMGIGRDNAVNYNCDEEGIDINYESIDCAITSCRECGSIGKKWRKKIDEDYEGRKSRK